MATQWRRAGRLMGLAALATLMAGCESQLKPSGSRIEEFITSITNGAGTISATLQQGEAPAVTGGTNNTVAGFAAMVTGGSSQQTVTGDAAFTRVVVSVPGIDNYYEITLPSGTSAPLILRANTTLYNMTLPVAYAVGDASTIGPYSSQNVRIISVGSGDVQVSVSWSDSSDVDLHVIDPDGAEIYYGQKTSPSGGTLDLDSNAACHRNSDNTYKSNENVVWPPNGGLAGTYTVKLDYWSSCGATVPTEYVVTVATVGGTPQVFTGQFTGTGDAGGAGSGTLITTFAF
jgi:hypothetical protein